jgi:nucleoside-diphosphate-sugar epimerase
MNQKKILITGITGFIGFHIAEALLKKKFEVIGLKRKHSDSWRCESIANKIIWVEIGETLEEKLVALQPNIIIHCAWNGAGADKRNDTDIQHENLDFLSTILQLTKKLKIEKFIGLGSQAEYGYLDKIVSESDKVKPHSAYGKAKVKASKNVEKFFNKQKTNWYWLRLFSFYGSKEATNWFVPFIINSLLNNKKVIPLSPCTQRYAYLYVDDLVKYIIKLTEKENPPSGIYNISGSKALTLKEVVEKIHHSLKNSTSKLDFGAFPIRQNQSILLKGNMSKFHKNIGIIKKTRLDEGIKKTIEYYKSEIK